MILDVGCGTFPRGDVNCDLYIKPVNREPKTDIDTKRTPNFVLCDGQYLPFHDKAFEVVWCSHVIEHVKNPYLLLKELHRVCKLQGKIELRCPHRFGKNVRTPHHLHYYTRSWFIKYFEKTGWKFTMKTTIEPKVLFKIPFAKIPLALLLPNEIQITIFKK